MNYLHSTPEAFKSQWNPDELPACHVGIELLIGHGDAPKDICPPAEVQPNSSRVGYLDAS